MFNLIEIKKKNVCIMGLMGSGKSVIGRDLSKYYNLKFYDTDKEIELKTKKNINNIFAENGELYFREIEEKICLELLNNNNIHIEKQQILFLKFIFVLISHRDYFAHIYFIKCCQHSSVFLSFF